MSRRPLVLLALAVASAIGALAVWLAAFSAGGRVLDAHALETFTGVARPPLTPRIRGRSRSRRQPSSQSRCCAGAGSWRRSCPRSS
jgi:hypothetical protein